MSRILLICLFTAALAFGEATNLTLTVDGITYTNVHFRGTTPVSVAIFHSTGVATIPLEKLPPELQKRFGYDSQQAAQWQAAQQKAAEEAVEEQRKAAAAVEWTLTVERVLADGLIARGCRTSDLQVLNSGHAPNSRASALTNRPTTYCPHPVAIFLLDHPKLGRLAEGNGITASAYKDGVVLAGDRTLEKWVYYDPKASQIPRQPSPPSPPVAKERVQEQPPTIQTASDFPQLRANGAFGFPQKDAKVLCDRPALRFSVWNNDKYLFVQAVLWKDNDSSLGKDANDQPRGDRSHLRLDLDADGKETSDVDRIYYLNIRPSLSGLRYAISKGEGGTTGMQDDLKARGAIRYVETTDGKRARVDTYLIPLEEISKRVGDKIQMFYYGHSPKPHLSINSVTYDALMPRNKYTGYVLGNGSEMDPAKVPDGRNDEVVSKP